jgi:uncharacterized protein YnzC (UPF0291/DUF896 family)
VSDQERDKLSKLPNETDDEGNDVEAHKHSTRDMDETIDDDGNDVEAHKHGGRDS